MSDFHVFLLTYVFSYLKVRLPNLTKHEPSGPCDLKPLSSCQTFVVESYKSTVISLFSCWKYALKASQKDFAIAESHTFSLSFPSWHVKRLRGVIAAGFTLKITPAYAEFSEQKHLDETILTARRATAFLGCCTAINQQVKFCSGDGARFFCFGSFKCLCWRASNKFRGT